MTFLSFWFAVEGEVTDWSDVRGVVRLWLDFRLGSAGRLLLPLVAVAPAPRLLALLLKGGLPFALVP